MLMHTGVLEVGYYSVQHYQYIWGNFFSYFVLTLVWFSSIWSGLVWDWVGLVSQDWALNPGLGKHSATEQALFLPSVNTF